MKNFISFMSFVAFCEAFLLLVGQPGRKNLGTYVIFPFSYNLNEDLM